MDLLGRIVLTSLAGDLRYDPDALRQSMESFGLDLPRLRPSRRAPQMYNHFLSAVNVYAGHEYDTAVGKATLRVVEGEASRRFLRRYVHRSFRTRNEVRDERMIELTFYHPPERNKLKDPAGARLTVVFAEGVSASERAALEVLNRRFLRHYDMARKTFDAHKVRDAIREELLAHRALPFGGGWYFLSESRSRAIEPLSKFALCVGADFRQLPVPATPEWQDALHDAFRKEACEVFASVSAKAQEHLASRLVTGAMYRPLRERYDSALGKASEYSHLLSVSDDAVADAAEQAMLALQGMQDRLTRRDR